MTGNSSTAGKPRTSAVLLFDNFSNHCLANTIEPLRAANQYAGETLYDWQIIGLERGVVHSSSGLPVQASQALREHPGGDYLMLMPSYGFEEYTQRGPLQAIRSAATRFEHLVGMDAGAWLLAAAGLLDRHRATIHRDEFLRFRERFPEVDVVADRYVIDRRRLSCGGVVTALELVLALIEAHHGAMLRLQIASLFMLGEAPSDALSSARQRYNRHQMIDNAVACMHRHLEEPLPIGAIAAELGLRQRQLETLFGERVGRTPQQVYKHLRLLEVRRLLEASNESITTIALRCGYSNASAMTRAFRQAFGMAPRELRRDNNGFHRHEQRTRP
ncbi:MAG: AraC family transcriptional regulator [Gammaproteobacteria bacterium]|nr:MAG: AraC family transcriptional regulator [Gammaproteobacteria bacterium]